MIVPLEILSYFYYVTNSNECVGVIDTEIMYCENLKEVYTLLDLKQILLN